MSYNFTVVVTNLTRQEVYECAFNATNAERVKALAIRRFVWAGLMDKNDKYTIEVRPLN